MRDLGRGEGITRELCGGNVTIPQEDYQVQLPRLQDVHCSTLQVNVNTAVLASSVVFLGLILSLCVFLVIIWFQELYEPRCNLLTPSFLS